VADNAFSDIHHILGHCYLSSWASCDVASFIWLALGRGVTRSKRRAMQYCRKAADNGYPGSCDQLASLMYSDTPHAREVGHVAEAAGVAMSAGVMEDHDVPPDVMTSVVHWLRKAGCHPVLKLNELRREALEGARYCHNDGCEVVGHLRDFKRCPLCRTARYCGEACQKIDWTSGGHKAACGTSAFNQSDKI